MSRPGALRILKKALGGLAVLILLLVGSWIAWNLWPRVLPPPLYPLSHLDQKFDPNQNGLEALLRLRGTSNRTPEEWEVPEVLLPLVKTSALFRVETPDRFWEEADNLQGQIKSYLGRPGLPLADLQKILELPQWMDLTIPQLGAPAFPLFSVLDYRRVIGLMIVDQMLAGQIDSAYARWRQRYLQDLSWLTGARSLISHLGAMLALEEDLAFLKLMIHLHPPTNPPEWVKFLRENNPGASNLNRALVFEYLLGLDSLERLAANPREKTGMLFSLLLNRPLLREAYNRHYRQLEKILRGPPSTMEQGIKEEDQRIRSLVETPLWWVSNPGGKMLQQLTYVSWVQPVKRFYLTKEKIPRLQDQIRLVLSEGPRPTAGQAPPDQAEEVVEEATEEPSSSPTPLPTPRVPEDVEEREGPAEG